MAGPSEAHRTKVYKSMQSGELARVALQSFQAQDYAHVKFLDWNGGGIMEFLVSVFTQLGGCIPTSSQAYNTYVSIDVDRSGSLDKGGCLCLVEALCRSTFRIEAPFSTGGAVGNGCPTANATTPPAGLLRCFSSSNHLSKCCDQTSAPVHKHSEKAGSGMVELVHSRPFTAKIDALEGSFEEAAAFLRSEIVGRNLILQGPFGPRLKVYLDYTASGQSLGFVNEYLTWLREMFANTHTEDSATGDFMTSAMHDALKVIERCVGATGDWVVMCVGTGSTGAMQRLQQIVGVYVPPAAWEMIAFGLSLQSNCHRHAVQVRMTPTTAPDRERASWLQAREHMKAAIRARQELPLVIVSGYEHHSNELSWREGLCDVIRIENTKDFEVNFEALERDLLKHRREQPKRRIIGSFSDCSNVTGMRTDLPRLSSLLRKYNAVLFVDFAASGPYTRIDCAQDLFDGFFMSPHKCLGGDGSAGLLVFRTSIYDTSLPPTFGGGGTVDFVGQLLTKYTPDIRERENAGTPGALQIFQCAVALELKDMMGPERIEKREHDLLKDFFGWIESEHKGCIHIMGNPDANKRHPIVSFNIVGPTPLHPRFVTVLLSELFGIQTRAGCSCAGPLGLDLLGMDWNEELRLMALVAGDPFEEEQGPSLVSLKPGWCRLNLHYSMDDFEMWYLKDALSFVVHHGARFLSIYSFDCISGAWRHNPPKPLADALHKEQQMPEQHEFGIIAGVGAGEQTSHLKSEEAREPVLRRQIEKAQELLSALPGAGKITIPPGPLGSFRFPALGPQPFFMVEESQILSLREYKEILFTRNMPSAVAHFKCLLAEVDDGSRHDVFSRVKQKCKRTVRRARGEIFRAMH